MMNYRERWDEAALRSMIDSETQENIALDYKESRALDKTDGKKRELAKDVSAFANSEGGTLIYGITEDGRLPKALDEGIDPSEITKEWIENVIISTIHQRVAGVRITQVPLVATRLGRVAYVIEVPQARTLAPHQASDHRYYRRFNFQSVPMEDYEVRDLLGRATMPDLCCHLLLNMQGVYDSRGDYNSASVTFRDTSRYSDPVPVNLAVENLAATPASHAIFTVDCPQELLHVGSDTVGMATLDMSATAQYRHTQFTRFIRRYGPPDDFPLWQGEIWTPSTTRFAVAVPKTYENDEKAWTLTIATSAPGMHRHQRVRLNYDLAALTIIPQ